MKNHSKYIVAFLIIVSALGYFVLTGMRGEKLYYKEVSELLNDPSSALQKGLRVSGDVVHDNFSVNKLNQHALFEITDSTGAVMAVEYFGVIPDAFEQGASVVLEGTYDDTKNLFTAKKLLAKCPSRYDADSDALSDDTRKHPDGIPQQS